MEVTPLCHKQTRNEGLVSHFKVIITPPWLALTISLPSSLFLFVAHWQCYLLPIITLSSWLHILIAVCAALINHISYSSIQPFSHQFTYFSHLVLRTFFWSCFTILSSSSCKILLSVFFSIFPLPLTNKKILCAFCCAGSQSHHGVDSEGRTTLSQTHHWQVGTFTVCIYQERCCVGLFIHVPVLLWKLNYAVDKGPYRYI